DSSLGRKRIQLLREEWSVPWLKSSENHVICQGNYCPLLLDQEDAFPEEVYEAAAVPQELYRLFVCGYSTSTDAEYLEKLIVESLSFALLVFGVLPVFGESGSASAYFIPAFVHGFVRMGLARSSLFAASFGANTLIR